MDFWVPQQVFIHTNNLKINEYNPASSKEYLSVCILIPKADYSKLKLN